MADGFDAFTSGLQGGLQASQVAQTNQQKQLAVNQQQMQQQALQKIFSNPNPTAQDYANYALINPQAAEAVKTATGLQEKAQQQADLTTGARVFAAANSGDVQSAISVLKQKQEALQNSGASPQELQANQHWIDLFTNAPGNATRLAGTYLATALGPDKFTAQFGKGGEEQRANELQPAAVAKAGAEASTAQTTANYAPQTAQAKLDETAANIANTNDQMANRAATFGLDVDKYKLERDKVQADLKQKQLVPQLQQGAAEVQNASINNAVTAQQNAAQATDLAGQFRAQKEQLGSGAMAAAGYKWRQFVGNENAIDGLRKQYVALRTQGMKSLQFSGPQSDKDIALLKEGFPQETADPEYVAKWLDAFANTQRRVAQTENAKAEWIAQNGSPGTTSHDIQVSGILIPKGTSFNEFISKNPKIGAVLDQPNAQVGAPQQAAAPSGQPSYMKYAK